MSGSWVYLDSSAFVKLCWAEVESGGLRKYLDANAVAIVSSRLLEVEAMRTAMRRNPADMAAVRLLLRRVQLLDITPDQTATAAQLSPPELRSLDAIHVAATLRLSTELAADNPIGSLIVAAYDERLADAARAHGIHVVAPS